ncbi:NAD(P)-dependent alcohol dehydrogenase [Pseudomonas chlororaphis]|nr:NAD(P)-dependent alcohol dehydrogenase [Pseudomonas chlororaphis]
MQIKAAVARKAHAPFTVEQAQLDGPRDDEVLVRIVGVGLCHTDLVARDQFIPIALPAVLGHEGAGIVEQVGRHVTRVAPGDRVVISFAHCGHCPRCHEQLPSYCQTFPQLNYSGAREDGSAAIHIGDERVSSNFFGQSSFASHALATERNVVKIDDEQLPLEILGPLGCGLQTGAGAVMRSMACPAGSTLAIFGGGPVGLAAVMAAKIQGCATVILVEPQQGRRELALTLGAHHVIDPTACDVAARIREILPLGVDFAFESSGRESAVEAALAALASHGLLGLAGVPPTPQSAVSINLASLITFGHRLQGIIEGDSDLHGFIPELLTHYKAGRFPFDKLIKTYRLEQINQAIADQASGECIKAVLLP